MPSTYVIFAIGCIEEFYGPTQMNQTFRRGKQVDKGGAFVFQFIQNQWETRYLEMSTLTCTYRDREERNTACNVRQVGIYIFKDQQCLNSS